MDSDSSDIESQSTATARARRRPVAEWVGTTLNPRKVALWKETFGTLPQGPGGRYNQHGFLAAQRYVGELAACQLLLENDPVNVVVDVGGAPHRTYEHLQSRGRYLMPLICSADRTRRGRCPQAAAEYVCSHSFEECTCYDGMPHCFLFTHSAYYIDPMWLWTKLSRDECCDAISVEHWFSDMFGGFYDEADWAISRRMVTMSVRGNGAPYVHTLPPWQCGWIGARGEMIEAEVLIDLDGCTRVVRLHPGIASGDPQRSLIWSDVEANPHTQGPVQFSSAVRNAVQDNARFTQVTFDVNRVFKFGPVFYTDFCFRGETVEITVPVNGVSLVAAYVVNRPRTPELFTEVSHNQKNRLARSRIPPQLLPKVLTAMVALGFVVNLNNEIDTLHTMTTRFSWSMKAHSVLLQFGSLTVRWWPWLLFGALVTLVGASVGAYFENEAWQQLLTVAGALLLLGMCWCCGKTVVVLQRSWRAYMEAGWVSNYADDENPRVPLLGHQFNLQRNLPLPASRFVRACPPASERQGVLTLGTANEKPVMADRMRVSGIVVDGAVPNALDQTQAAEESAVANRVLCERKNPEEEALRIYEAAFQRPEFAVVPVGVDTGQAYFMKWIEKLKQTYPVRYIEGMIEARRRFEGVECPPVATKAFLKIEKSAAAVTTDAAKATKPRLIQPPEDVDKAMTGPAVWQLWNKIKAAWNGRDSNVMYCSGYTGADIGDRVDAFLNAHTDGVVAWSVDQATYDATLSLPVQRPALAWYVKLGMPAWLVSWLMRVRSRGTTPNGVTYMPTRVYEFEDEVDALRMAAEYRRLHFKVLRCELDALKRWVVEVEDFQMTSGRMDTNLTDSVILVASTLAVMPDIPYLFLVCGDDGFLMLRQQDADVVNSITEFQRRLGLKPEGSVTGDRSRWEFCSKLFWHAVHPVTGQTITVLGSKPFRGIARMGVSTSMPGAANAEANSLAIRIESGHVPFLGAFADATHTLCRSLGVRAKGRPEWSAIKADRRYLPSPLNWAITLARYGLGEEHEAEFKARLATLKELPIVLGYEPARAALLVDEA